MYFKFLAMFVFSSLILFSQDYIRIDLDVITNKGEKFDNLYIGVHPDATYDIDYELGEKSKPPFPPPGNLHCAFIWTDTLAVDSFENIHSDEVYYPIPNKEKYHYRYNLYIRKDNDYDTATVRWGPISEYIDSAYFSDIAEYLFKIDMKEQTQYKIGGNAIFIDDFIIDVYFSKTPTSITESFILNEINIFPNPAEDVLFLGNQFEEIFVYDLTGKLIKMFKNKEILNISDLNAGLYVIRLGYGNNYINKKFIKN